jgi:molybdopterin-binding protein
LLEYAGMPLYRIGRAAELLGVSADTVRRWADAGRIATTKTPGGQRLVDGADLARFAAEREEHPGAPNVQSARNRITGIVTRVRKDSVMAQVDIQAGSHRLVSLLSAEAAEQLGLAPGVLATAVVKATNVVVERAPDDGW